jgi:hypothetical protein
MREPKRLAHRQAERNRARALKQWSQHEDEDLYTSNYRAELDVESFDVEASHMASPLRLAAI